MRAAEIARKTNETDIRVKINLDGTGKYKISTPNHFLNHMLELFSKHSFIDLEIIATGDVNIDFHHTVEDIGICLGQAFNHALGTKEKINRYGFFILPMDESLACVAIDICNRSHFSLTGNFSSFETGDFDIELLKEFLQKFTDNSKITLHIDLLKSSNLHHSIEAIFKCMAKAINMAISINPKIERAMSTKGVL
ncbi:MAG TPA: imidazoleglycerol-phosphate dehydratase HisB [bacterium]|nr:imidazoleglycerol-phosphate dehydratase HisB [bacterium]HOL47992.1 imidazoleglycerol-phosphate dehydratase HisB [bacterium]HPQ18590.1 imidazoleglycerol-phosphate dehydratase HisB [bacterium]